ncbi:hypothetical protein EAG_16406 [Camponotus floridanus]|uniref:Uncharacterized protein n=1 Tax=Camponotus floridanus TaxID=104421 RepID=E2AVA8_CAMFO|nr:hypothetical protein EAG_16406 [Camponotus floridanus]
MSMIINVYTYGCGPVNSTKCSERYALNTSRGVVHECYEYYNCYVNEPGYATANPPYEERRLWELSSNDTERHSIFSAGSEFWNTPNGSRIKGAISLTLKSSVNHWLNHEATTYFFVQPMVDATF